MYVCLHCQAQVEMKNININVTCPKCSGRILFKETPELKKNISCR